MDYRRPDYHTGLPDLFLSHGDFFLHGCKTKSGCARVYDMEKCHYRVVLHVSMICIPD